MLIASSQPLTITIQEITMARQKYTLTCEHCHRPFKTRNKNQRYCSKRCYGLANTLTVEARLLSRIAVTDNEDDCWLWTGAQDGRGYGKLTDVGGVDYKATRLLWTLLHGPIPHGLVVCHACDTPACVNPKHLFLGTQADNMRDAAKKRRLQHGERRWNAKLTADDVRYIRGSTEPLKVLSARFGVTEGTISWIRHGHTWQHIT